jgi:hypothetical protein
VFLLQVVSAVQLNDQQAFITVEIEDVNSERMLAPELEASELAIAKARPKDSLGISSRSAKIAGQLVRGTRLYTKAPLDPRGVTPSPQPSRSRERE